MTDKENHEFTIGGAMQDFPQEMEKIRLPP